MRNTREHDVKNSIMVSTCDIVDWLNNPVGVARIGDRTIRYGAGGVGASDLLGIMRGSGIFVACEVKVPGKKPTEEQKTFLRRVASAGGIAFCAHSSEEAKFFLTARPISCISGT